MNKLCVQLSFIWNELPEMSFNVYIKYKLIDWYMY